MDHKHLLESADAQLARVLDFFPRVEAKASVVLAVDTGMLGFIATKIPPFSALAWWAFAISGGAVILLGISLWHLYKGAFPNLRGGNMSLVYFRAIADRTEANFIDEFMKQTEEDHEKDLLGQVWRNSEILTEKFNHLKNAFLFLALSIPPWVASLVIFVTRIGPHQTTS